MFYKAIGFDYSGVIVSEVTWRNTRRSMDSRAVALIGDLKRQGYRIGILSNAGTSVREELARSALNNVVDVICLSGEESFVKPDPKIFEIFIERLKVRAEELIYIDDSERSLETADEVGYTPIHFRSYEQLVEELKGLKVIG
jgi:HAD superfamily hydrolase (TIGR01509 family)